MPKGFLPNADNALLGWSSAFSEKINASPAAYSLSIAQAANYAELHAAFATAMAGCAPAIRCKSNVATKNAARALLRTNASQLSSIIKGQPTVTDAQRIALGLNVRAMPTPSPQPAGGPGMQVISVPGWTVRLRLYDMDVVTRTKPAGVIGASLFTYVGDEAPTDVSEWTFALNTGMSVVSVNFSSTLSPGTKVWLTARWFNGRKQPGPLASPRATNLHGGAVTLKSLAA